MEVRIKKCKSGNVWKLVNESWSNSNGWGHKTTIFRWDYDYEPCKIKYLNRTWEYYTYQSCMYKAVETIYQDALNRFIENYKRKNDIVRFKKGQKDEVIELFKNETLAQDLKEIHDAIRDREFDSI